MAKLTETAAAQVAASIKNLQPATVVYAETECKGWAVNDSEPEVVDNSVTILQCLGKDGKSIATLTNFPCHPTVIDDETEPALISADWVGAFYKAMSASLPGEHLFLQGAVGCWMQPETPERTFVLAEKYGNDLAGKTLAALKTPKPLNDTALRSARKVFDFPLAADTPYRSFALAGLIPRPFGDTVQTEVAWFAIGPAQFATHPGETAPMYATQTRALMETGPKFILGLGLDELGYICPPDYFDHPEKYGAADYLIKMSPGKESGSALMSALETVIP
ncbi:MAG: Alkaline ceramidase [Candidatus Hydrogenedentes bacterium]|nr:Alkaline ceramidase [Candidatus Hydrogenedentota bacterium]